MLKLEGNVLKLSMWMGALILAGLVQVAQDVQDVFGAGVAAAAAESRRKVGS